MQSQWSRLFFQHFDTILSKNRSSISDNVATKKIRYETMISIESVINRNYIYNIYYVLDRLVILAHSDGPIQS